MIRWLFILAVIYLALIAMLAFFENSLVYPAPRISAGDASLYGAEDVRFQSADGTALHGWYFENRTKGNSDNANQNAPTIIFFHGNAECVGTSGAWLVGLAKQLNANAFIFDYRGYGESKGKPREDGIVADGQAAVEWAAKRAGCAETDLILLGRSVGGGVAVQVAAKYKPKGLILVSTFPSMVEVAASKFWWVPVRMIMKNRYESTKVLAEMDVPLLQIHGDRDSIIPMALGRKLFEHSASTKKSWHVAENRGHNNLELEGFIREINEFIEGLD